MQSASDAYGHRDSDRQVKCIDPTFTLGSEEFFGSGGERISGYGVFSNDQSRELRPKLFGMQVEASRLRVATRLILQGLSERQIAQRAKISRQSVRNVKQAVVRYLGGGGLQHPGKNRRGSVFKRREFWQRKVAKLTRKRSI